MQQFCIELNKICPPSKILSCTHKGTSACQLKVCGCYSESFSYSPLSCFLCTKSCDTYARLRQSINKDMIENQTSFEFYVINQICMCDDSPWTQQCMGRILCINDLDPSVSKIDRLHVDIFQFFFIGWRNVLYIFSKRTINFPEAVDLKGFIFKLKQSICH